MGYGSRTLYIAVTLQCLCVSIQMGYGSRTLQVLCDYYLGKLPNLSESTCSEDQRSENRTIEEIKVQTSM